MSSRATRSGKAFAAPFFVVFLAGLTDLYDRIPRLDAGPGFRKTLTAGKNEGNPARRSNPLYQHQININRMVLSHKPVPSLTNIGKFICRAIRMPVCHRGAINEPRAADELQMLLR